MGKRELLLILGFGIAGLIVYQLTGPARPAGSRQVTVGGVIDHMRRAVRGNRASAAITTAQTQAIDTAVTDVRLRLGSATVTVHGEERADVAIEMRAWSNGYDDAEAQSLARQTVLKLDPAGNTLIGTIEYPAPGSQRATVTMKVPSRLRVRMDSSGPATIDAVNAVELGTVRGRTTISNVAGAVTGTHRGGELTLTTIGAVRLTTQASDVKITTVKDLTMTLRGGELRAEDVNGAIEIESSQGAGITLDKLEGLSAPLRVNANGGTVTLKGLRTEARIDGRNTGVDVVMDRAAAVAIYNEGDDGIALTPPPGGYKLDALVRDGRLAPPELLAQLGLDVKKAEDASETRATGAVAGGGPTITLRATRGDIVLRPRSPAK